MKNLFLIRGLPGSGKTTLARDLQWVFLGTEGFPDDVVCVAADDFMVDGEGNYLWQPEILPDCHRKCLQTAVDAMEKDVYDVIVHNTFTREKEMEQYMEAAKEYGYRVVRLVVENTHGNTSVHGVPEKTLQSMRDRFSLKL